MTSPIHAASVPVFAQMLCSLTELIDKAAANCAERNIEPIALLQARLYPDMFPFSKQVQVACDFARGVSARLAGAEVPVYEDREQSFDELRALIERSLQFIRALPQAAFDNAATREIVIRPGTPKERKFSGQAYLLSYGLPQFFFHVTTSYALLRHNGVPVGKRDYMGVY